MMPLVPADHPLKDHFTPPGADLHEVERQWHATVKDAALAACEVYRAAGKVAIPRKDSVKAPGDEANLGVIWSPRVGVLAWLNMSYAALFPTPELPESPVVCALYVNCRSPSIHRKQHDWLKFKNSGFRPQLTPGAWDSGDPARLDIYEHQKPPMLVCGLLDEIAPLACQTARQTLRWEEGWIEPFSEMSGFVGPHDPEFPWEFWSPRASAVRDAWKALLRPLELADLAQQVKEAAPRGRRQKRS